MTDFISIEIDDERLLEELGSLAESAADLTPLMREIAGDLAAAVEENFEEQGRPKWVDLSDATIKARERKGYWPGKILQQRGELAASIVTEFDATSAQVGTNKIYAAIHQFGGKAGRNRSVDIPARPFLAIGEQDIEAIIDRFWDYFLAR
jgi:phage virion morphogenesis protein